MPRNLRKALTLTAFLFLLAALFPIQKETIYKERKGYVDVRELTFFWQPIVELNAYLPTGRGWPDRSELDRDSCTLEFVIIVSIGVLYFGWLERPRKPKVKRA
jgi:hypothetical protein